MTLVYTDLIVPSGEIAADLFGEATATNVAAWLTRAVAKAAVIEVGTRDLATAEYAYYLAFSAKARQIASLPAQYTEESSSIQHTAAQARFFQRLAEAHLGQFQAFLAESEDAVLPPGRPVSSSVQTVVVF